MKTLHFRLNGFPSILRPFCKVLFQAPRTAPPRGVHPAVYVPLRRLDEPQESGPSYLSSRLGSELEKRKILQIPLKNHVTSIKQKGTRKRNK